MKKAYVFGSLVLCSLMINSSIIYANSGNNIFDILLKHLRPSSSDGDAMPNDCSSNPLNHGDLLELDVQGALRDAEDCPSFRVQVTKTGTSAIIGLSDVIEIEIVSQTMENWEFVEWDTYCDAEIYKISVSVPLDLNNLYCTQTGPNEVNVTYTIVEETPSNIQGIYTPYHIAHPVCSSWLFPNACFEHDEGNTAINSTLCLNCLNEYENDGKIDGANFGEELGLVDNELDNTEDKAFIKTDMNTDDIFNYTLTTNSFSEKNFKFKTYPNPFKDNVNIEFFTDNMLETQVQVIDLSGKIILDQKYTTELGSNALEIDLSHQPEGIYIIRIWNGKEFINSKVFKSNK